MGCTPDRQLAERSTTQLYFVLDSSASMQGGDGAPNYWIPTTAALGEFLTSLDNGWSVGLGLFPKEASNPPAANQSCLTDSDCGAYGPCEPSFFFCMGTSAFPNMALESCVAEDYSVPDVSPGPALSTANIIRDALAATEPDGSTTPTTAALGGAFDFLSQQNNSTVESNVVLLTDGEPQPCTTNTVSDLAASAEEALSNLSIRTHVISLGAPDVLDPVAAAGGTGESISADATTASISDALAQVAGSAASCRFLLPLDADDPSRVNLILSTPSEDETVPKVNTAQDCSDAGWYYDNPATPTSVFLCPASCSALSESTEVEWALGCATVTS